MTWQPQNPKDGLSRMDRLVMGDDAARHELLGCVVGYGNGPIEDQARDYLRSLLRGGQMSEADFKHWWRELVKWENAGGKVNMPSRTDSADHPRRLPPPPPQHPTQEQIKETEVALANMKARKQASNDAIALNTNPAEFLDAVKTAEREGRRAPGSYDGFVAQLWAQHPDKTAALKLPRHTQH